MNEKILKDTAKEHEPKSKKQKNAVLAFLTGGIVGMLAQVLLVFYKEICHMSQEMAMPLVIVTFIVIASLLTGLGVYDKIAQHCGAGLFIPITGFANALASCALEGKSEGFIFGIGSNMFKLAGSVLVYGIVSSFVFGSIRYLFFGG